MNISADQPILIEPDWPAPGNIRSVSTTRIGGVSQPPFDSFNLGIRVGDDDVIAESVENRRTLREHLSLLTEPCWLWQVHGTNVVDAARAEAETQADAAFSNTPGAVCAVMSADCLPVLFADRNGSCIAAAHAGWRGLLSGVLEASIGALPVEADQLLAWLGPAIGPTAFEVGDDVREAFESVDEQLAAYFTPAQLPDKWMADLPGLARWRLQNAGLSAVYSSDRCTYSDSSHFYSYRRDGAQTGRMASLIWIEQEC